MSNNQEPNTGHLPSNDALLALATRIGQVDGKVDGVKSAVDTVNANVGELRSAVAAMARLEVQHTEVRGLQMLQQKQLDEIRVTQEEQEKQITALNSEIGPLKETRGWVIRVIGLVVSGVVLAVLGLVIIKN